MPKAKVDPNKKVTIVHFLGGVEIGRETGLLKDVRYYDSDGKELGKNANRRNGRRAKAASSKSKH